MQKRLYKNSQINSFRAKLGQVNWKQAFKEKSIDENYNYFLDIVSSAHDSCIPKIIIKIKPIKRKAWLTKGIKTSCKHKRLLKILNSQFANPILDEHYKKYTKLLRKTVSKAKKLCYINKIKQTQNISKTMWSIVKERTNKLFKRSRKNITLRHDETQIENPHLVANTFNNFFVSVGAYDETAPPPGRPAVNPVENSLYLRPVDIAETVQIIRNLKNKSSYGFDEIPPSLIRQCVQELAEPLSLLINQSFSEGVVPAKLKISIVKPIHKRGDPKVSDNYRPIALLPSFSKIFETAITNRLYSFCEKFKVFDDSQNGFRRNRSTTMAVFKYINKILDFINNRNYAVGILLDLSKAYDRVMPSLLLQKLYGVGVRGVAHKWLTSYFQDRMQYVEIQHTCPNSNTISSVRSKATKVTKSIPQGSVVGCFLFLIYINDLPKIIKEPSILFADDMSIIFPTKDESQLNEKLNNIFRELLSWLKDHNLVMNFNKTKLMVFRPRQKTPLHLSYNIHNINIECVDYFTLLGISIDCNLNWKSHVQNLSKKLSRFIYALNELKRTTDTNTAKIAYNAYAHSWLRYGIALWGNSTDATTLLTLQKKCIRILANIGPMESCKPFFKQYKILTVPSLYILETCKIVRQNIELFKNVDDSYTGSIGLRKRNKLILPKSNLSMHQTGPYSMAIRLYNALPKHLKEIDKYNKFVIALTDFLNDKCFYKLNEYYIKMT